MLIPNRLHPNTEDRNHYEGSRPTELPQCIPGSIFESADERLRAGWWSVSVNVRG